MLSVIIVGRNDSHGYNMHKRVAISINCLASLLEDPDDEILFVDCNTREDLPTLPEAIEDTLTDKAKVHIRVLRIRPPVFKKHNNGSRLPISESLSKNVGIRRSNPRNRWILSTTSDAVVVPLADGNSLTAIVRDLEEGTYALPRFGVPESFWGTLDRKDPETMISKCRQWGVRFRLNNVVENDRPDIVYDNPGDFQLFSREQAFQIQGFDERMTRCWHHDSNLARRLFLLNGSPRDLLEKALCYHCDHTWEADYLHNGQLTVADINSIETFVLNVVSPYQEFQSETWGLPHEKIEEIRLGKGARTTPPDIFGECIPAGNVRLHIEVQSESAFNNGIFYDIDAVMPYLLNALFYQDVLDVGYIGANGPIVKSFLDDFAGRRGRMDSYRFHVVGCGGQKPTCSDDESEMPDDVLQAARKIFIVDFINPTLDKQINLRCVDEPQENSKFLEYRSELVRDFKQCIRGEEKRIRSGLAPSKFIFLSAMNTWGEDLVFPRFNLVQTAYGTHTMFGTLRVDRAEKEAQLLPLPESEAGWVRKVYLKTGIQGAPEGTILHSIKLFFRKF